MSRHLSSRLLTLAACGAAGCWTPKVVGDRMQRDIDDLRGELHASGKALDEERASLAEQVESAEERIKQVDVTLQSLNRAARKTDAGLGVRIDELQRELQELRGGNELLGYRLGQLEGKLQSIEALSKRVEALETQLPGSSSEPTAAIAKTAPKDAKGLLAHAKKLASSGKTDESRGVFREVIRRFPKKVGVTDEAYFQIGELYFKEKKYRGALQEYIQVIERFASGKLADDAYFRIGTCSTQLGNFEDAQIFFKEILNNHKKSPLVAKAKQRLKEVDKRLEREKSGKGRKR